MRALLAFLLCCSASSVLAEDQPTPQQQPKCGSTENLRKELAKNWREVETTVGLMADGQSYLSIFVSPGGETWTAIVGNANGMSCLIGFGRGWFQGEVPTGDPV